MRNHFEYIVVWGKLYDRNLFKSIKFWEGIQYEDEDIMPQLVHASNRIMATTEQLYQYRIRENSIMTSDFSPKYLDIIYVCEKRIERYRNWKMHSMYKWAVKDYYFHLLKLKEKTIKNNYSQGHRLVLHKIAQWTQYKVKFSVVERLKFRKLLKGI